MVGLNSLHGIGGTRCDLRTCSVKLTVVSRFHTGRGRKNMMVHLIRLRRFGNQVVQTAGLVGRKVLLRASLMVHFKLAISFSRQTLVKAV